MFFGRVICSVLFSVLFLVALVLDLDSAGAQNATVLSVTPTGSVKQVQQIVARFSTDMVAFGDPRSYADPLKITCTTIAPGTKGKNAETPPYKTRWIDSRQWSLDFQLPLPAGWQCTLLLEAKDMNGAVVTGAGPYSVSTSGPAITHLVPRYGAIEPDQHFVVATDGPIDSASVESGAYFEVAGMPDKVGVTVVSGPVRDQILRVAIATQWELQSYRVLIKEAKDLNQVDALKRVLVIAAKRKFPEETKVVLHWTKAVKSPGGMPVSEEQSYSFTTLLKFAATFSCDRTAPERPCNPILPMSVSFSASVPRARLEGAKLTAMVGGKEQSWIPGAFKEDGQKSGRERGEDLSDLSFNGPFPEKAKFKIVLPKDIKDGLGRPLINQSKFPLEVSTDEYSPLVKFAAPFGVIESADPVLPLSLRNVETEIPAAGKDILGASFVLGSKARPQEVIEFYHRVQLKDWNYRLRNQPLLTDKERGPKFSIPKPGGPRDFELIGIPLKGNGLHIVEVESPKLATALLGGSEGGSGGGKPGPMYVATAALVTNLSVHLKKGRESSGIWVTRLDTGKPVDGAEVGIYSAAGVELAKGKTDSSGFWRVGAVKYPCDVDYDNAATDRSGSRYDYDDEGGRSSRPCEVFAFAKRGDDFSFVSNEWSQGIEEYRFNLSREYLPAMWGPIVVHTVLNRGLAKPGETVSFKHIVRDTTEMGFKAISNARLPKRVLVVHQGTRQVYAQPFVYDKTTGTAVGEFKIPKTAPLGLYQIYLSRRDAAPIPGTRDADGDEADAFDWSAKSTSAFMVGEYRLPLMESTVKVKGENLVSPTEVAVDLSANYLSGGPAAGLAVKLRSQVMSQGVPFNIEAPDDRHYNIFAAPVKVGTVSQGERNDEDRDGQPKDDELKVQSLTLSADGGREAKISGIKPLRTASMLNVEMEYRDPNGEVKVAKASKPLFPADYIVGLDSESWYAKAGEATVVGLIVGTDGKPKAGRPYKVEAYKSEWNSHRKRVVGGFYSYDSKTVTTLVGTVCTGTTDAKGKFVCKAQKLAPGSVIMQARTADSKGRETFAQASMQIYAGGVDQWWAPSDSDRIDVLADKKNYQPGETAKLVIKSPFPASTVLVSIEREGVLDTYVREITRDNPVVEVPLKKHYAPNVFASVLAIRGRVGDPKPTALVDLAKPAMKLGYAELRVGWKGHELKVALTPNKKRYTVRETAKVKVKLTTPDGAKLPDGTEVTFIAIDEALEKLRKNWSTDLLTAMMGQRKLAVSTTSSQNQVIGKRHFGSKAKPAGGGGGGVSGDDSRELFDPALLWIPKLKVDANGEVEVPVKLNDSMTSFRLTAVAHGGMEFFGSASVVVESTKDIILYSGLAPAMREDDAIKNVVTVRNTMARPVTLDFSVASADVPGLPTFPAMTLRPSEAKTIVIPMKAPALKSESEGSLAFEIQATEKGGKGVGDTLKVKSRLTSATPVRVLQATMEQIEKPWSVPVKIASDAIQGRGGIEIHAKSTLASSLAGVRAYMLDYPYSCLEQQVSRQVALENRAELLKIVEKLPSYMDSMGLLKFFPISYDCGSMQLTRYVLSILKANKIEIPNETLSQILSGLEQWTTGRTTCPIWNYHNLQLREEERVLAFETLSLYGRFKAPMYSTIKPTPNLWANESLIAWKKLLLREKSKPELAASMGPQLVQADNILRGRTNLQGTALELQKPLDSEGAWRLFSSSDQEAITLFGMAIDDSTWKSDVGRLARSMTARMKRGVWDSTMSNAWGVTYMRHFSEVFEKDKVTGVTNATFGPPSAARVGIDWSKKPAGDTGRLPWPKGDGTLTVKHEGGGKPWVMLRATAAIPLKNALDMGYVIKKRVLPVLQKTPGKWTNGDVVNVELTISAKYDHPWVVLRDPIPSGASHLGNGLAGESGMLDRDRAEPKSTAAAAVRNWPETYSEKRETDFISYAGYLYKGTYRLTYRIRLNSSGEFKLPPTRVEAMYSPEAFGELPILPWVVVGNAG